MGARLCIVCPFLVWKAVPMVLPNEKEVPGDGCYLYFVAV